MNQIPLSIISTLSIVVFSQSDKRLGILLIFTLISHHLKEESIFFLSLIESIALTIHSIIGVRVFIHFVGRVFTTLAKSTVIL